MQPASPTKSVLLFMLSGTFSFGALGAALFQTARTHSEQFKQALELPPRCTVAGIGLGESVFLAVDCPPGELEPYVNGFPQLQQRGLDSLWQCIQRRYPKTFPQQLPEDCFLSLTPMFDPPALASPNSTFAAEELEQLSRVNQALEEGDWLSVTPTLETSTPRWLQSPFDVRINWATNESGTFRILSLDGGGTWSVIQVRALMDMFGKHAKGHEVLRNFELAVGCSGGSMVLAALLADFSLDMILDLFMKKEVRDSLFPPCHWSMIDRALNAMGVPVPRYSTDKKLDALRSLFCVPGSPVQPDTMMTQLKQRCLVIGFDYDTNRARFFRSYKHSRTASQPQDDTTVMEAVHASSTAPVKYFDKPADIKVNDQYVRMWDGAVAGYNNPALAGIVEAQGNGISPAAIRVLSIGTGTVRLPVGDSHSPLVQNPLRNCLTTDIEKMCLAIVDDPPDAASFIGFCLTGNLSRPSDATTFVRLCPILEPVYDSAGKRAFPEAYRDDHKAFSKLIDLEIDAKLQSDMELLDGLARNWIAGTVPNQPVRAHRRALTHELGSPTFSAGKQLWRNVQLRL
jgi:hypothetical protein